MANSGRNSKSILLALFYILMLFFESRSQSVSLISSYKVAGIGNYWGLALASSSNKETLFIADNYSGKGLSIFDVTSPQSPSLIATYVTSAQTYALVLLSSDQKYLFITDNTAGAGLTILDVSTPSSPAYKGSYTSSGVAYVGLALTSDDSILYVTD